MAELKVSTTREINSALRKQMEASKNIKIGGVSGHECIAVGIEKDVKITVNGRVGDFFGALNSGASIILNGNANRYLGDSMLSGEIIVNGEVGNGLGIYMQGGIIILKGDAKNYVGKGLHGGIIIIDGGAGDELGSYMFGGEIVVTGDCGKEIGKFMSSGTIYVGGSVVSLGRNAKFEKMSNPDVEKIKKYCESYRLKQFRNEELFSFKKIVPSGAKPWKKL
ncbi:MAG: hypothetical protein AB1779_05030 [Candidatus Thermoplasmatota archaeon]